MTTVKDFTEHQPGAVSKNLKRLREESDIGVSALAKEVGSTWTTMSAMERQYEPPTNHPLIPKIAHSLAKRLNRSHDAVLADLTEGGSEFEFLPSRLAQITKRPRMVTNKEPVRQSRVRTAPKGIKLPVLLKFLNTDSRIKMLAHKAGLLLPNAKVNAAGKPVGKSSFAIRERAVTLMKFLKENDVDVSALIHGQPAVASTKVTHRNGRRGLNDVRQVMLNSIASFNEQRMKNQRNITMPLNDFETLLRDYLKMVGINANVLIDADIQKLFPK